MTVLRGPADADHYRVKVGNFGDRFYTDPLEAHGQWDKCDDTYPSISTVKKAAGKDWSFVSMKRIGTAPAERLAQIATLPDGERHDAIKSLDKRGLEQAAQRGTNVHLYAERKLKGENLPLMTEGMPGFEYISAVEAFFADHAPKLYAAEYVVIHRTLNGVGYGGTPDAIVDIGGELFAIDWKTRGEESAHGGYAEEAAQIAAGAFGDYMIVDGPNGAHRQPIPRLAGGLIVSIKPDGYKVYPVELSQAWDHWTRMHAWWIARRTEAQSIGKPWAPGKRVAATKRRAVEPLATVTTRTPPEEGAQVDVDALRARYVALGPVGRAWVDAKREEAHAAGVDFHLAGCYTARRARIMDGLITLAETETDDDDALRAIVRHVISDQFVEWPSVAAGAVVGSLSATEAAAFAGACALFVGGRFGLAIELDGPRLVAA